MPHELSSKAPPETPRETQSSGFETTPSGFPGPFTHIALHRASHTLCTRSRSASQPLLSIREAHTYLEEEVGGRARRAPSLSDNKIPNCKYLQLVD